MHKQPVIVVSIPKAGTHLLTKLLDALGYHEGGKLTPRPKFDHWYMLEQQNAHTVANFINNVEPYHPLTAIPILFIYRHPLDILISEAYYRANQATTAYASSFYGLDLAERITQLLKGSPLLPSLEDRLCSYLGWLELGNVIPISFEELIGERGGGDCQLQLMLIESIQRRLGLVVDANTILDQVYSESSPTFRLGQIGNYRSILQAEHYELLAEMPDDFITSLGYQIGGNSDFSSRISEFRDKPLILRTENLEDTPILVQNDFFQYNIVYFRYRYYAVPQHCGTLKLNELENRELAAFVSAEEMEECKFRIAFVQMSATSPMPNDGLSHLVETGYLATNIVYFQGRYYAVPQCLGDIDFASVCPSFLNSLMNTPDLQSIKTLISFQWAYDYLEQEQCEQSDDNELESP